MSYQPIIGLEIHVQLNTKTKAFSSDANAFGQDPNSSISPVVLALPGALPVVNEEQIRKAILLGLAVNSRINRVSYFDRKNYSYPDLPKGYQITQENQPICIGGQFNFLSEGKERHIRIHHIHMEEDAGKSIHDLSETDSLVDLNRAGTPLLEIVTEPDFRTGQEVYDFLSYLQRLVRYLGISDGNMEEGSLRCDCNVSIMPEGSSVFGERCEVKNVNSKRFARTAINYEIGRQEKLVKAGKKITRATLHFDSEKGTTHPMRLKEDVNDYRYMPDPDLPPVRISEEFLRAVQNEMGILPEQAHDRLVEKYLLSHYDAEIISREKETFMFFEAAATITKHHQTLSNVLINQVLPKMAEDFQVLQQISIKSIAAFCDFLKSGQVAKSVALAELSTELFSGKEEIDFFALAKQKNMLQSNDEEAMKSLVKEVVDANPDKVKAYQNGKKGLKGFFVGQVMAKAKGKGNPKLINELLSQFIDND